MQIPKMVKVPIWHTFKNNNNNKNINNNNNRKVFTS